MHETHVIKPIITGISEHAKKEGGTKVSKVCLKIGEYMGIKEDSFRETFSMLAKDTICEDCELEVTFFPASRVEVVSFDMD